MTRSFVLATATFSGSLAHYGPILFQEIGGATPLDRSSAGGSRRTRQSGLIHTEDMSAERGGRVPRRGEACANRWGVRTVLAAPLLKEGVADRSTSPSAVKRSDRFPINRSNWLRISRSKRPSRSRTPGCSTNCAHARADESLQQQTATADVLKVISRSAFDLRGCSIRWSRPAARLARPTLANNRSSERRRVPSEWRATTGFSP